MQKKKVIKALKKLDLSEFSRLEIILKSKMFNFPKGVVPLFDFLKPFYSNGFTNKNCNKEKAIERLKQTFGTKMNTQKLNQNCSNLLQAVEFFWQIEELQKDQLTSTRMISKAYIRRYSYQDAEREMLRHQRKINFEDSHRSSIYLAKGQTYENLHYHPERDKNRLGLKELLSALDNFDKGYFLKKLKFACEIFQRKRFWNESYENEVGLLDEILVYAKIKFYKEEPLIKIYMDILQLARGTGNQELFKSLINQLDECSSKLDSVERSGIFILLTNEANHRIRNRDEDYRKLKHALHKVGVKKNCILVGNWISPQVFTNIILCAHRCKDFEFVNQFVKNHQVYLPEEYAGPVKIFCQGDRFFCQGKFQKAIYLLNDEKLKSSNYNNLSKRVLLLMCAYELCQNDMSTSDTFDREKDNYIRYFRKDRKGDLSDDKRYSFLNFGLMLDDIFKLYGKSETTSRKLLQAEINELLTNLNKKKQIVSFSWLYQKIIELRDGK